MSRYTPSAQAWIDGIALSAVVVSVLAGIPFDVSPAQWLALLLLMVGGAFAHLFPIRSTFNGATFQVTNVFLVAGAVILPAPLLTPLVLVSMTPGAWLQRHRPGTLVRWAFNTAQTALAVHGAAAVSRLTHGAQLNDLNDLAGLVLTAAVFTVVQEALVGVVISLNHRKPLLTTDTFTLSSMLSNGLINMLGITVGGLWLAKPVLLVVVFPLLVIAHRLTRDAYLAEMAQIDAKTGLHNSRHFEQVLEDELAHSLRLGRPLAVLFADVDLLRQVNNRYGHLAGDRVLREISNVMRGVMRPNDVVARFGGEEFVALLPGTDPEEAQRLAERVRAAVADHRFTLDDGAEIHSTISIGIASLPDDGTDVPTLIKQADLAMYCAKQTRNAVVRAQTTPPSSAQGTPPDERPVLPQSLLLAATRPSRLAPFALWGWVAAGALATAWSVAHVAGDSAGWATLLPFIGLAVCSEFMQVRVYEADRQTVSYSFTIAVTMAALTMYPEGAPLVSLSAALFHVSMVLRHRHLSKALFNLVTPPLAATLAGSVYSVARPHSPEFDQAHLFAALLAVITFYVFNAGTIWVMVSLHTGRPLRDVVRTSSWYYHLAEIFIGLTGAFLGGAHERLGLLGAIMFAVPLLIMQSTLAFLARTDRKTIATLEYQAMHDLLTGLPNRTLLRDRLQQLLLGSHRDRRPLSLLIIDLDRFKDVNDAFGHHYGDLLLKDIGQRFVGTLRESDTIARLGGDEFAVLLPGADGDTANELARRIIAALEQPFLLEGHRLDVQASVGIAVYPDHGADADTLLRRADIAMYAAKQSNTGSAVYAFEHDNNSADRIALAGELRDSLSRDELVLHYQPQIEYGSGRVTGVEALVRWKHAGLGLIPPDGFIPLAEQTGLIRPLGTWVLNEALRQVSLWQHMGLEIPVAVNLSMRNLHDPELPETIQRLLARWKVPADRLRLEITESSLMADPPRALAILNRVRAAGVHFAIDDFGTGYSSLAYLKRLPVDEIKIDKSFVQQMAGDDNDAAIVRSTIGLGHDLGLNVVAEGVEDRAAWDMLGRLGCDSAQGYYVSRPMSGKEIVRWLVQPPEAVRELQAIA